MIIIMILILIIIILMIVVANHIMCVVLFIQLMKVVGVLNPRRLLELKQSTPFNQSPRYFAHDCSLLEYLSPALPLLLFALSLKELLKIGHVIAGLQVLEGAVQGR